MNRKKIVSLIFAVLTIAITAFIFMNSLNTGDVSKTQSDRIVDVVQNALDDFGIEPDEEDLSFFIRKTAHFSEYFVLCAVAAIFMANTFKDKRLMIVAPFYSLGVAICDEFIMQAMTLGRGPKWMDVFIDFGGAVCGFLIIFLIIRRRNSKKKT